jgi:glutamate racemase
MEIARCLFACNCKALVVACNTATAAAVHLLREKYPDIPIVGIEPGLKPAAAITRSQTVGVLATERTLQSSKFRKLHALLSEKTGVRFIMQACPGLADLVEKNERHSARVTELVRRYTLPLIEQNADTIVLGCTHYPFLQGAIEDMLSESATGTVNIIDTGIPVTRQLIRLLDQYKLRRTGTTQKSGVHAMTTGDALLLADQFEQLLQIRPDITHMAMETIPVQPVPRPSPDKPERKN